MSSDTECRALELLRPQYERQGYTFTARPGPSALPQFMADYQPDAIARKGDRSIAIEITTRRAGRPMVPVKDLVARFKGHPGWELHVVYSEDIEPEAAPTPARAEILSRLAVIETMAANDNRDAALVLAWAALEAAARVVAQEADEAAPKTPREALQMLEHLGRIDYSTAQTMRRSLDLRHKVVHGDLSAEVPRGAIADLVGAVRAALAA